MEKQTRVNKYKKLREEMKEEVAIDRHITLEEDIQDDEFLSFLPQEEKMNIEDTLMEPLTYETLEKDNEEVKQALNEAKVNVGKEQYNTRLDILNKIKQEDDYIPAHEFQTKDFSQGHVVKEEPQKKMTLLEKLAAMSPEEDAEELKKFEEDLTVADLMGKKGKQKKYFVEESRSSIQDTKTQKSEEIIEDNEEVEENSKIVTILNYVIVAFILVFIVLVFFIVKQMFF